jgi:hypothetical protein
MYVGGHQLHAYNTPTDDMGSAINFCRIYLCIYSLSNFVYPGLGNVIAVAMIRLKLSWCSRGRIGQFLAEIDETVIICNVGPLVAMCL